MHTSEELRASDFTYRADGTVVDREEVMPAVGPETRVGVAMGTGAEGTAAGNFVLSCVTAFYDHLRQTREDFFEYPNYYTFQTTDDPADYRMLDVYPDHKNVALDPDGEQLVRAITDRAIDVLVVPETDAEPAVEDVTRHSAERRVDHCYRYAADGKLDDADFSVAVSAEPARDWYETTLDSMEERVSLESREWLARDRETIVQEFERIDLDEALASLPVAE